MDGVKLYLCAGSCEEKRPKTAYSGKQFKKKGKRVCKSCLAGKVERETVLAEKRAMLEEKKKKIAAMKADSEKDRFQVFVEWLKDGGVKFPHLYLKTYDVDYRGVHASHRIDPKEIILEVPFSLLMTTAKAKASPIGQKMIAAGVEPYCSHSWLACHLVEEKYNPKSPWKPYLDILPVDFATVPIFFKPEELAMLEGSLALQMQAHRKEDLKDEYDLIVEGVPDFEQYSLNDFIWARVAVITRIFGMEIDGEETEGLVPMADMLNHRIPSETAWEFDENRYAFTIEATKRLLRGQQIYDSYGRKCNSRFFVNYGFTLDENRDNQCQLDFSSLPSNDDPERSTKVRVLGRRNRIYKIPGSYRHKNSRKCLSFLRVAHASGDTLKVLSLTIQKDLDSVKPVSPENEWNVLEALSAEAEYVLSGFPTTYEEDCQLLESKEVKQFTFNQRNCVVMRRGEKKVLMFWRDLHKHVRPLYDIFTEAKEGNLSRIEKLINKKYTVFDDPTSRYIRDIWWPLFVREEDRVASLSTRLGELCFVLENEGVDALDRFADNDEEEYSDSSNNY